MADARQVKDAKVALQHNLGLGGACVVVMYTKYQQGKGWSRADQTADPDKLEQFEKAEQGDRPHAKL
jgi:sterol carrier protein 2